jgi:hypothetical protein
LKKSSPLVWGLLSKIGKSTLSLFPGRSAVAVMEGERLTEVASLPWPCLQEASSDKETNFYYLQNAAKFRFRKLRSQSWFYVR